MGDKDPNDAKHKQVIPQQSYLSDDLIIQEILTRLPIKSILRFKSVSKQWYSTLSSSYFANAQLMKSPLSHPSAPVNTLFIGCGHNYYLFSYDDDDDKKSGKNFEENMVKLDIDFDDEKDYRLRFIGCCNGLICLGNVFKASEGYDDEYFIIWNPATRKLHKYLSHGYLKQFNEADNVFVASGFGYASSVTITNMFEFLQYSGEINHVVIFFIYFLSEKIYRWRKIDFDYEIILDFGQAVLINEKLYWAASSGQYDSLVLSFDLGFERFEIIKFDLEWLDCVGVMGGCLSKCKYDRSENTSEAKLMHIFESPGVIMKSIGFPKELKLGMTSQMIGFTKTDKYFVRGQFNELGVVDTGVKPIQYTTLLRFNNMITIARYVPSLVSPFPIEKLSTV